MIINDVDISKYDGAKTFTNLAYELVEKTLPDTLKIPPDLDIPEEHDFYPLLAFFSQNVEIMNMTQCQTVHKDLFDYGEENTFRIHVHRKLGTQIVSQTTLDELVSKWGITIIGFFRKASVLDDEELSEEIENVRKFLRSASMVVSARFSNDDNLDFVPQALFLLFDPYTEIRWSNLIIGTRTRPHAPFVYCFPLENPERRYWYIYVQRMWQARESYFLLRKTLEDYNAMHPQAVQLMQQDVEHQTSLSSMQADLINTTSLLSMFALKIRDTEWAQDRGVDSLDSPVNIPEQLEVSLYPLLAFFCGDFEQIMTRISAGVVEFLIANWESPFRVQVFKKFRFPVSANKSVGLSQQDIEHIPNISERALQRLPEPQDLSLEALNYLVNKWGDTISRFLLQTVSYDDAEDRERQLYNVEIFLRSANMIVSSDARAPQSYDEQPLVYRRIEVLIVLFDPSTIITWSDNYIDSTKRTRRFTPFVYSFPLSNPLRVLPPERPSKKTIVRRNNANAIGLHILAFDKFVRGMPVSRKNHDIFKTLMEENEGLPRIHEIANILRNNPPATEHEEGGEELTSDEDTD